MALDAAAGFRLERMGIVMSPDPGDPREAGGVLNPAAARGPDGKLYLFPRLVADGNYSRIGIGRVGFDGQDRPTGFERLGVVLEPEAEYERNPWSGGGVEDPRITFLEPLGCYVMAYTAYGPRGPRVALATSQDLFAWRRLGLVSFGEALDGYLNKDAMLFPVAVADPDGQPALAILHRPSYEVWGFSRPGAGLPPPAGIVDPRPSVWISYSGLAEAERSLEALTHVDQHRLVFGPEQPWEARKVGGGAPPVATQLGWLVVYHGVDQSSRYSAGVAVLDPDRPERVRYRSPAPLLVPELPEERAGTVPNVVFPTGVDRRDARHVDVYYGMADARIGVARLRLPDG